MTRRCFPLLTALIPQLTGGTPRRICLGYDPEGLVVWRLEVGDEGQEPLWVSYHETYDEARVAFDSAVAGARSDSSVGHA